MTKNSSCSCPQTCKLITSWVNSVKTARFQSTRVTPASTPLRCAADTWEAPLMTSSTAFNETSVFTVLACARLQFSRSAFQRPFCGSPTVWHAAAKLCLMVILTALPNLCPSFLGQNHGSHSQQACCSGHQLWISVLLIQPFYAWPVRGAAPVETSAGVGHGVAPGLHRSLAFYP